MPLAADTQTPARRRSRRLLIVRIVFYGGVGCFGAWILASVVFHLWAEQKPFRHSKPISKMADKPEEIFRCYFDTLLLFNALMNDFGHISSDTRCEEYSIKSRWNQIYAWDTYPWRVVHKGSQDTPQDLGIWRYRRYDVWSRCRLNDQDVLARSPALAQLARVHADLDELRRALTREVRQFDRTASPIVQRIRKQLRRTRGRLKKHRRRMKRERKLSKYRLRKWGIREPEPTICPVGF